MSKTDALPSELWEHKLSKKLVLPAGIQPATSSLGPICSMQLSYGSINWLSDKLMVLQLTPMAHYNTRLQLSQLPKPWPVFFCLINWHWQQDSNLQPLAPQATALFHLSYASNQLKHPEYESNAPHFDLESMSPALEHVRIKFQRSTKNPLSILRTAGEILFA